MGSSPPNQPPQNYHPTTFIIHHCQHYPPHTKTCPSNKLSRIKPSVKSPTSSTPTETTGTNSAPRQPIPRGRPRKVPTHPKNNQNTKMPKTKDSLLSNCTYKKIRTASCSSPSTMLTSGGCTRKPKLPSGRQKRLIFQQTSRTESDCLTLNITSSPMFSHSLLPLMGSSTRTYVATSPPKSRPPKPGGSMASRSQSRTSIAKHTPSSSTRTSRIQKRNCTYFMPSKQYHASNAKPTGLSNGATPPTPVLPNV